MVSRFASIKPASAALSLALVAGLIVGPLAGVSAAKPPAHIAITLSATVPTGTGSKPITSGGATNQQSITFTFTSNVANTTFRCALDNGTSATCTSPKTYSSLAVRSHKLTVSASAPHAHGASSTFTWSVDTTPPPAVTFSGVPTGPVAVSPAITFTGEAGDTFTCSIDGATPTACTPSNTGTKAVVVDGTHTLTVVPTDAAGNVGPDASASWTLDSTPPVVLINDPPPSPTNNTATAVHFTVNDPTATVTCDFNGVTSPVGTAGCGSNSWSGTAVTGPNTLVITATDEVGNQGQGSVSWTVSATAPDVPTLDQVPGGYDNNATPQFKFSGATLDSFKCSLDPVGTPVFTTCTSPYTTASLGDGHHMFFVEGISGGNPSAAVEYTWIVDTVPPVLTVTGLPSGVTRDTSVAPVITVDDANPLPATCNLAGPTSSSTCDAVNNLKDGSYTMTVSDTDLAGNTALPFVANWTVDTTPPVVTITAPPTLTSPVKFMLSEPGSGTAKNLVQLMNSATNQAVPTVEQCHSLVKVVPCTGGYRYITLKPTAPLVPGQHYAAAMLGGIVQDVAGNQAAAASLSFRGQRSLAPNTVAAHYNWAAVKNRKAIGHSYRTEHLAGAKSSWPFKGSTLIWWTRTGPTQGRATVTIGHSVVKVNNYAKRNHARVKRVFRHLGSGTHTVTIKVLGKLGAKKAKGTAVAIDAFTAAAHRTANPVLVSSWGTAGSAVRADLRGAGVTLTFRGTSFSWRTKGGPSMGIAKTYVDGKLVATVDNYTTRSPAEIRTVGHLTDALHTVRILVTGHHHKHATGSQIVISHYSVG